MKKLSSNIVWAVATLFILTVVFSFLIQSGPEPVALTINQLVEKVNNGDVAKIMISGQDIEVTLKDKTTSTLKKESEAPLTDTLKNLGVDTFELQKVALEVKDESGVRFWLGVLVPTLLPLIVIVAIFWFVFRQAKGGASQAFTFGKANIRLFTPFKDRVTFKDVAGLKEAKRELEEVVDFLKNPKKYLAIGARIPRGVLLMGSPGTGKTLLARAVAGEAGVPFFHISASEFVEMFVGVGASRTRDAFTTAKKAAPAILFIDEIDAVGRERGTGVGGGHDEREQTLNQILVEMDGFERDARLIVLAATNRPDVLDAALLRPGRFDRRVMLDLPDKKDREAILKIHARGKAFEKDIDLAKAATRTPGFSGADLANLLNEAAILAASKNQATILQEDVLNSVEKVLLGPARLGRVISDKERAVTAYHEAGHALVTASLKDTDPVHKVSIVSRGRAGGYTLKLPSDEQRLKTRTQFISELAAMLGGFVSEQETFGDVTTGASNDLKEASNLARSLVVKYGMSEKLGPMTFGNTQELIFLGREISHERNYSEQVASEIDREVSAFIQRAHLIAKKIITTRAKTLKVIADALLEKENLEQEEFDEIMKKSGLKPMAI
ncbi:MAG: cell division protease FtsH [Parcubacteria group bacterium Gr01-1014_3]|nr:MAG: cell division protease FtsH [Parcubacteria group bacterium Gr01-1014_3]